jgi:hypothetical protein
VYPNHLSHLSSLSNHQKYLQLFISPTLLIKREDYVLAIKEPKMEHGVDPQKLDLPRLNHASYVGVEVTCLIPGYDCFG